MGKKYASGVTPVLVTDGACTLCFTSLIGPICDVTSFCGAEAALSSTDVRCFLVGGVEKYLDNFDS